LPGVKKMPQIDTLIHNATVVTVDDDFQILTKGAVAVADEKIVRVWAPGARESLPVANECIDGDGMLIMPGLVNTHTHLPMSLFRGLADDLSLDEWLNRHIFPAEARYINPDSVRLGTRLAIAEMLLNGTTCCCDGYFLAHRVAETVVQAGLRAVVGQGVIDFPAAGVPDPGQNIIVAEQFVQQWQNKWPLVQPAIFCHSPYTCSTQTLQAAKKAAGELKVLFQIHVAETEFEARQCLIDHGCSPVAYLDRLGLLDGHTLLIHAVWVGQADIEIMASRQVRVAHCPESNMKLASGISPVPDFLTAGIAVGLGTDGCASNNDLDLWGEMDTAAKLHKVQRCDPTVMDAATVVRMATIEGARALGLDHAIGSLAAGKQADLILVDLAQPHLTPMYHPASHLVYAVRGADVRHVMVAGRWVVRDRVLLTIDVDALLHESAHMGRVIGGLK
jgi:5-methylthioadenosine/S-adenosylhomocysteine deaminase